MTLDLKRVHDSWKPLLKALTIQRGFKEFIRLVKDGTPICPNPEDVFNSIIDLPVDDVRVVIVGQDPYPDLVHATGIAFGVRDETRPDKLPLSLRQIRERVLDMYPEREEDCFDHTLRTWRMQGVLLLNRYLTCLPGKPGSHEKMWDTYVESFVFHLSQRRPDLVWYLLGGKAKKLKDSITKSKVILTDYHPAAVRYGHKMEGKFEEINGHLDKPIEWMLPF